MHTKDIAAERRIRPIYCSVNKIAFFIRVGILKTKKAAMKIIM